MYYYYYECTYITFYFAINKLKLLLSIQTSFLNIIIKGDFNVKILAINLMTKSNLACSVYDEKNNLSIQSQAWIHNHFLSQNR